MMHERIRRRRILLITLLSIATASVTTLTRYQRVVAEQDCNANSVIYCGVSDEAQLRAKYNENQDNNVQAIYSNFGIDSVSDLEGMQAGSVTSTNQVYVGNKLVADNAMSAGRQYMDGSTAISNGAAYLRPPSTSFNKGTERLPALIKMDGNTFKYAVILSCGNPVMAQPVAAPTAAPAPIAPLPTAPQPERPAEFTVIKRARTGKSTSWLSDVAATTDTSVDYEVTITNTSNEMLKDVTVRDRLPTGFTLMMNHGRIPDNAVGSVSSGLQFDKIAPGASVTIVYDGIVAPTQLSCSTGLTNTVTVTAANAPTKYAQAIVRICAETKVTGVTTPNVTVSTRPKYTETPKGVSTVEVLPNTGPNKKLAAWQMPAIFIVVTAGASLSHMLLRKYLYHSR